jgi:transposase
VLAGELFWRDFKNRRQVGGYLGLGDAKYASGAQQRELGISKAGNTRARSMMVELAWLWVQHQPQSALARWFNARAPKGASAKRRRIAIVALARKLAVTLWRYLREGLVPEGALMKA